MSQALLAPIAAMGFAVAFLHAAIPTHWLPFVMAGRGQGWTRSKTLAVTALAGFGHVVFTTLLGVVVVGLGIAVDRWTGKVFPWIAGSALLTFGAFYLIRSRRGHHHSHAGHEHHHHAREGAARAPAYASDRTAVASLFALLTFSPCEGFLPVYLSGIAFGWAGFLFLSAILAIATLAGMMAFTWLTLAGLERVRFSFLERYEGTILGGILCALGIAVILFER